MKKIVILFLAFCLNACSSDSSEDVPCTPIECLNNGVSNLDCGCDCPIGYVGVDCSTEVAPNKIFINKIRVKKFPNLKPNGSQWDSFVLAGYERPDTFPTLSFYNGGYFYSGNIINNNFSYGNDNDDFIPNSPIEITQITSQYTIALWDDDTLGSSINQELMGGYNFYIYSSGFPNVLTISTSTGLVAFELYLTYEW